MLYLCYLRYLTLHFYVFLFNVFVLIFETSVLLIKYLIISAYEKRLSLKYNFQKFLISICNPLNSLKVVYLLL